MGGTSRCEREARAGASATLPDLTRRGTLKAMTRSTSDSAAPKSKERDAKVLGRSAATGRFVLKPATKAGSVTQREAKTAVKSLSGSRKK